MDYASSLSALSAECDALKQDPRSCNFLRRRLHAKVSLLELDLEEDQALSAEVKASHVEVVCRLVKRLGLKFVKRSRGLTTILDLRRVALFRLLIAGVTTVSLNHSKSKVCLRQMMLQPYLRFLRLSPLSL